MIDSIFLAIDSFSTTQLYVIIFIAAFIESFPFLGILFPGTLFLVVAGVLASHNYINGILAILVINLGCVMGDAIGYYVGRRHLQQLCLQESFIFNTEQLNKCKGYFEKHGNKSVFLGRFVGLVRPFLSIIAGFGHMSLLKFLFYTISSLVIWSGAYFMTGYLLGNLDQAMQISKTLTMTAAITVSIIFIGILIAFLVKNKSLLLGLKYFKRLDWLVIAFLFLFSILFLFTIYVGIPDRPANNFIIQRGSMISWFMIFVTNLAGARFLTSFVFLLSIFFLFKKQLARLVSLGIAFVISGGLVEIIKMIIKSERPDPAQALVAVHGYSFPSGHTTMAVAVYGLLAYFLIKSLKNKMYKTGVLFFVLGLTLMIGVSRIYLGAHWPLDVLGGYVLGGTCLFATIYANELRIMN